jgi:hypothetical protein
MKSKEKRGVQIMRQGKRRRNIWKSKKQDSKYKTRSQKGALQDQSIGRPFVRPLPILKVHRLPCLLPLPCHASPACSITK